MTTPTSRSEGVDQHQGTPRDPKEKQLQPLLKKGAWLARKRRVWSSW